MKEFIGRIIDVELAKPGTKNRWWWVVTTCEVDGCTIPVKVGSGFINAERMEMTINSPIANILVLMRSLIQKIKTVCCPLNLPVFKQFVK